MITLFYKLAIRIHSVIYLLDLCVNVMLFPKAFING